MSEIVEIGGLTFEMRRSDRRRTLGVSVGRRGELCVYAPNTTAEPEISAWVRRKLLWVHRKLALKSKRAAKRLTPEYVTGESFKYLGRTYRLQVVKVQREPLRFEGSTFLLRRDARQKAEQHFRAWYSHRGLDWIKTRVRQIIPRVGIAPAKVVVSDLGYRWGSCSRNGAVRFHWKLFQLPVRLVDYVIVHELAHLATPHHGPDFWASVERAVPDWKERKEHLAECAAEFLLVDR